MKKIISILTLLCLFLSLSSCGKPAAGDDALSFYYLQSEFTYGTADGVIASEIREIARRTNDMEYLLSLYLSGPQDNTLTSPFPQGTQLVKVTQKKDGLEIELSEQFSQLSGIELTLACACLSSTCFGLTDVQQVTITAPGQSQASGVSVTMTRNSLTLTDNDTVTAEPATETTTH